VYQNKYRIETTRLRNWDYAWDGKYFITICTNGREPFLGQIHKGLACLSENGKTLER